MGREIKDTSGGEERMKKRNQEKIVLTRMRKRGK